MEASKIQTSECVAILPVLRRRGVAYYCIVSITATNLLAYGGQIIHKLSVAMVT